MTDLVPERLHDAYAELARRHGAGPFPSPLPPAAALFYSSGGCYALAIALAELTGGTIDLYYAPGAEHPVHAFVVVGDLGIDYRGEHEAERFRGGAARIEEVDPGRLVERLRAISPDLVAQNVEPADVREAAARAALFLTG